MSCSKAYIAISVMRWIWEWGLKLVQCWMSNSLCVWPIFSPEWKRWKADSFLQTLIKDHNKIRFLDFQGANSRQENVKRLYKTKHLGTWQTELWNRRLLTVWLVWLNHFGVLYHFCSLEEFGFHAHGCDVQQNRLRWIIDVHLLDERLLRNASSAQMNNEGGKHYRAQRRNKNNLSKTRWWRQTVIRHRWKVTMWNKGNVSFFAGCSSELTLVTENIYNKDKGSFL